MSLFEDAAQDYREIHNSELGASLDCTIVSPDGITQNILCRMSDTSQTLDVNTRERISGRQISLSVSLLDLAEVGFEAIRGIDKKNKKPWKVLVSNILGVVGTYKVKETAPDNTLGGMLLHLEEMI